MPNSSEDQQREDFEQLVLEAARLVSRIYAFKCNNPDSASLIKADKAGDKMVKALRQRRDVLRAGTLPF
ncbi:hypothetical protein [Hymenobacter siberiensis]|uniref:hypothetical protein n=1 Tax=Hymenobacter siberiensis TaxID=2848396 RepID=UPI001C1E6EAE|nr:hypothetical protein [Hymenobacter siberiensis]